jgi:predicted dehydrogenase
MKQAHLKSGRHFLAGYVWRFVPFYVEINKIIQSGVLGTLTILVGFARIIF